MVCDTDSFYFSLVKSFISYIRELVRTCERCAKQEKRTKKSHKVIMINLNSKKKWFRA